MNNVQCANELALSTSLAAHVNMVPVTLLIGKTDSVTYLGGEKVPTTEKYPCRRQFIARQKAAALVGVAPEEITPRCTLGDFAALTMGA